MSSRIRSLVPLALLALVGCDDGGGGGPDRPGDQPVYSIGAIYQSPAGRTLYLHSVSSLDQDLDAAEAIEIPGNARHWAHGGAVFVALAETPEIVKYVPDDAGALQEAGRVSFQAYGLTSIPAGNAFVSDTKAYLFAEGQYAMIVWNPVTMTIAGSVELASLARDTFQIELHEAVVHGDRVYVPLRYVDFAGYRIAPDVNVLIVDATSDAVLGVASDERCVAASTPTITPDGTVYVAGDGRAFLAQIYAMAASQPPPGTCLLRILPNQLDFDAGFSVDVPALTGGPEMATALWSVSGNVAFAKLFDASHVPEGTNPIGPSFWSVPTFTTWRFELGDTVVATEVEGLPPSIIDFGGSEVDGRFYLGIADASQRTTVYELDPATNAASVRFTMPGLLREIHRLR